MNEDLLTNRKFESSPYIKMLEKENLALKRKVKALEKANGKLIEHHPDQISLDLENKNG